MVESLPFKHRSLAGKSLEADSAALVQLVELRFPVQESKALLSVSGA